MLKRLAAFFAAEHDQVDHGEEALHLAAAVLLIEVAKADQLLGGVELERLRAILQRDWSLSDTDLADLVDSARTSSDNNVSFHDHIERINNHFSAERKFDLLRGLWDVACADGEIHPHEELLIRRLADLLYLPHADFIRSKLLALESRDAGENSH